MHLYSSVVAIVLLAVYVSGDTWNNVVTGAGGGWVGNVVFSPVYPTPP